MISIAVIKTELKEHKSWFLGWLVGVFVFGLMILLIYPGEADMQNILDVFEDPLFQAILGNIGGQNPSYALWISLMSQFFGIMFVIFGILLGVRVAMKSISAGTSEIIYSMPLTRFKFLFNKIIAGLFYSLVLILAWFIPLVIPIKGNAIGMDIVLDLFWWAMLFVSTSMIFGILLGNLTGSSGRGTQIGILFVLAMFILQVLANLQSATLIKTELWQYKSSGELISYTLLNLITDINMVNWFTPSTVILGADMGMKYIWIIVFALITFTTICFLTYQKKDLIDGRGIFSRRKKKTLENTVESADQSHVKAKKSVKKSFYTFWVRPLEKRFPFTADLIYSDRRALMILFIAVIMFYPLQLLPYIGDVDAVNLTSFLGTGGIMAVFGYGYNLTLYPPWAWWLVTQALGVHWILLVPMVLRWIKSVPARDRESGTGDLVGSLPVMKRKVVFQRLFGVFLELIWTCLLLIFWYILSLSFINSRVGDVLIEADLVNGVDEVLFEFNNPFATGWVIMALISLIPFYMFLTSAGVAITLFFRRKGLRYAKIFIFVLVLLFIVAYSLGNPDLYWISGIFGMYNPVGIIFESSFKPGFYGVFFLIGLTCVALYLVRLNTKKFSWLKQEAKEIMK